MIAQNRVLVNLTAIEHNYLLQKQALSPATEVMPVIKANAYGHGMVGVATALRQKGAKHFAVARPEEGILLRQQGCVSEEILVLGAAASSSAEEAIHWRLSQTVCDVQMLRQLETMAAQQETTAFVHIKLDTGMNRIGCKTRQEAEKLAEVLKCSPHIKVAGIYTHFADADNPVDGRPNEFTQEQLNRFNVMSACFDPAVPRHVSNSAMTLICSESSMQMVRQGISLYGYPPVPTELPFRPAMTWITEVTYVKTIEPGECVSYGCTYIANRKTRVATIAVGYGDGYHRLCSGRAQVLIHGKRAPIIGRICMDQAMVDVTNLPEINPGDEVVLMGRQGNEEITAEEIAGWAETIPYEIMLSPSERIPRIQYHEN